MNPSEETQDGSFSLKSISDFHNEYYIPSNEKRFKEEDLKFSQENESSILQSKIEKFKKSIQAHLALQKKEEDELLQAKLKEIIGSSSSSPQEPINFQQQNDSFFQKEDPTVIRPIINLFSSSSLDEAKEKVQNILEKFNRNNDDWYQKMILPEYLKNKMQKSIENSLAWIKKKDEESLSESYYHQNINNKSTKNYFRDDSKKGVGFAGAPKLALTSADAAASLDKNKYQIQQQKNQQQPQQNTLYVSNLPLDFTEEELRILFSPQGRLKKVKLYKDNIGMPKGDGIVTYYNSNDAKKAVIRFNGLNIGEVKEISVVFADFSKAAESSGQNVVSSVTIQDDIQEDLPSNEEIINTVLNFFPSKYNTKGNFSLFFLEYYSLIYSKSDLNYLNILEMNIKDELKPFKALVSVNFNEVNLFGKSIGVMGLLFKDEYECNSALTYFTSKGITPKYHAGQEFVTLDTPDQISLNSEITKNKEQIDPTLEIRIQHESEELDDFFNSLL